MRVAFFSIILLICTLGNLVGCQSASEFSPFDRHFGQSKPNLNTVYVSCNASLGCEFARVDEIVVIDEKSKQPTSKAVEQGIVRLEGTVFSSPRKYALSLLSGEHELYVRFFPISNQRAENFHVIHNFLPGHAYSLVMYRQRGKSNSSLLDVALPRALCVDLRLDDIVLRRFCRAYDVMTGSGEFIEESI